MAENDEKEDTLMIPGPESTVDPADDDITKVAGEQVTITMQDLINRARVQSANFGPRSYTRLLLANMSRALIELTCRLDSAERALRDNGLEVPAVNIIEMPPGAQPGKEN